MSEFFTTQKEREEELFDEFDPAASTISQLAERVDALNKIFRSTATGPAEGQIGAQFVPTTLIDPDIVREARTYREALQILVDSLIENGQEAQVLDLVATVIFSDDSALGSLGSPAPNKQKLFTTWMLGGDPETGLIPDARERAFQVMLDEIGWTPDYEREHTTELGEYFGEYSVDLENQVIMRRLPGEPGTYQEVDANNEFVDRGATRQLEVTGEQSETQFGDLPPPPLDEITETPPRYLGGLPSGYYDEDGNVVGGYVSGQSSEARKRLRIAGMMDAGDAAFALENIDLSQRPPRYYEWDEAFLFADYSPEQVVAVQEAMVAAGFLRPDQFAVGFWDARSQAAMFEVMDEANKIGGQTWNQVLERHAKARENMTDEELAKEAGIAPRRRTAFMKPDYNTLADAVQATFESRLGRKPQAHEMELLAAEMSKNFRAQYNAQDAAAQQVYDQGNRELLFGETPAGVTAQDVDPYARMSQSFTKLFGAEEDRVEAAVTTRNKSREIMQTLAGLESFVGR